MTTLTLMMVVLGAASAVMGAASALWLQRKRLAIAVLRRELKTMKAEAAAEAPTADHGECPLCAMVQRMVPQDDARQVASWIGVQAHQSNPDVNPESIWAGALIAAVMIGRGSGVPPEAFLHFAQGLLDVIDVAAIRRVSVPKMPKGTMPS